MMTSPRVGKCQLWRSEPLQSRERHSLHHMFMQGMWHNHMHVLTLRLLCTCNVIPLLDISGNYDVSRRHCHNVPFVQSRANTHNYVSCIAVPIRFAEGAPPAPIGAYGDGPRDVRRAHRLPPGLPPRLPLLTRVLSLSATCTASCRRTSWGECSPPAAPATPASSPVHRSRARGVAVSTRRSRRPSTG